MTLSVLYRGPLSSCNYACGYCPFAKHHESDEEHAADGRALARFLDWCEAWDGELRVFFTPWGEALTQPRYQEAMVRLSRLPHVTRVAAQTNLSARLDWLDEAAPGKVGLWATYHPSQTRRDRFLAQCTELLRRRVSFSVGVVGLPESVAEVQAVREALPAEIYVWVNAVKALAPTYDREALEAFTRVDPLFPLNLAAHPSLGRACAGGHTVISVDGEGVVRSCHFLRTPLGNLFEPGLRAALRPRPCAAATCGCHIGYVHLEHLGLAEVFGDGILERARPPG